MVLGDYFTKWMESYSLVHTDAGKIAEVFVHHFICYSDTPDILHTDQGLKFDPALVKAMCKLLCI